MIPAPARAEIFLRADRTGGTGFRAAGLILTPNVERGEATAAPKLMRPEFEAWKREMERVPRPHMNRNVRRERDPRAAARQFALLVCGLLLTCGFVVAARQQFAAVRYGYQSEELRRERERLLAEQKRLLLALEEKRSPAQLERAAREIGLQPPHASQIGGTKRQDEAPTTTATFVGGAGALRR